MTHFFISITFIIKIRIKLAKSQAKSKQHHEAEFCYLKILLLVHSFYDSKLIRDIPSDAQKTIASVFMASCD